MKGVDRIDASLILAGPRAATPEEWAKRFGLVARGLGQLIPVCHGTDEFRANDLGRAIAIASLALMEKV
jgi:hypothetical protein